MNHNMHAMSPGTAADGNAAFMARLTDCLTAVQASRRDFALRAEISPTTFNNYFNGVEPGRDTLVKIARAAGVSAGWLADGIGPRNPGGVGDGAPYDLTQFRKNVEFLMREQKGMNRAGFKIELPEGRVTALLSGATPNFEDLVELDRKGYPVRHVLASDLRAMEQVKLPELGRSAAPGKADRTVTPQLYYAKLREVADHLLTHAGVSDTVLHVQSDTRMSPTFEPQDLLVAVPQAQHSGFGLYLCKDQITGMFSARLTQDPKGELVLVNDNPSFNAAGFTRINDPRVSMVGPIIMRLTAAVK